MIRTPRGDEQVLGTVTNWKRSREEDRMAADRASVQTFFDRAAQVWQANDGGAFAHLFAEDGSLINPFGERADGRGAVGAMYSEYFKGMLSGTSTSTTVQSVRAVGEDHV